MADTTAHITAGLPITKSVNELPASGKTVAYITAGLPKEVTGNSWYYIAQQTVASA